MRYNHLPPIYFLHIPRTAGTSLRLWLETFFDHDDWLEAHEYPEVRGLDSEQLRKYEFFSGHLCYEFVEQLRRARSDVSVITWLRDPVARQLSAFRYAAAHYEADPDKAPSARTFREWRVLDPVGFLETKQYPLREANYQVRYLTRVWEEREGQLKSFAKCLDLDDLASARRNLESFEFVGITEEMSRSIALFCDRFNLPLLSGPGTLNETKNVESGDNLDSARDRIAALNEIDCELYAGAKREFYSRYAAMLARYGVSPGSVESEMIALRPAFLERLNTARCEPKSFLTSACDMGAGLITERFGPRFSNGRDGRWLRWADNVKESVLYLPIKAGGTVNLELQIDAVADRGLIDKFAFYAGSVRLKATRRSDFRIAAPRRVVFDIAVPGDLRAAAYTQLRIEVPDVAAPRDGRTPGLFSLSRIEVVGDDAAVSPPVREI